MPPSIVRVNVSKSAPIARLLLFCVLATAAVYGGVILEYWPDPLAFLDPFLIEGSSDDSSMRLLIKAEIMFVLCVGLYGGVVGAKEVQHVSFFGDDVVVKLPFSEKRYPIRDIRGVRYGNTKKQFYPMYLDFGYKEFKLKIENYQQKRIEAIIEQAQTRAKHRLAETTSATSAEPPLSSTSTLQGIPGSKESTAESASIPNLDPRLSPEKILREIQDRKERPPSSNAIFMLLISMAAFAGLGLLHWNIELIVFLIVAVFIHETGHLLAMRIFKYTNLKMLFVPFFGGLAIGEPKDQNARKIALIAIAGPLFGLASALAFAAIWLATGYEPLYRLALLSVVVNAFNLLPIKPLDGGLFWNEILFSRSPRAELAYSVVAIAVAGFFALKLHSFLIGIIPLVIFLRLMRNYELATLASKLRRIPEFRGELTVAKVETIVKSLARALPYDVAPAAHRQIPDTVSGIWALTNKIHPKASTSVLLSLFYLCLLFGAVPFLWGFLDGIAGSFR